MFIVQSHIICEKVEGSIITVGFRQHSKGVWVTGRRGWFGENVVFGDEMSSTGMQGTSKEGRENEISEGSAATGFDKEEVKGDLDDDVEGVEGGDGNRIHQHGTESVKEDLKGAEEGFSGYGVEEDSFKGSRKVGI